MQRRSLIAVAILAAPAVARAQAFPDRTITLVSGFAPGGCGGGTYCQQSNVQIAFTAVGGSNSAQVQVVVPGGPAVLPAEAADEVLAAVEACLSNVRHHVGHDAPAWVLLEELADAWVVTVRDEGPGIAAGRLEESAAQGRLGVRQSVVGRLHDLGGEATLRSVPGEGTEWELRVPRPPAGRGGT